MLHLSQAVVTQLDLACADSACREAEFSSLSLLQTGLQMRDLQREASQPDDWFVNDGFDPVYNMYGLNQQNQRPDGFWELSTHADGKCYLKIPVAVINETEVAQTVKDQKAKGIDAESLTKPVVFDKDPAYYGFIHGECPQLLPVQATKRLAKKYRQFNPGLVTMPNNLKGAFPTGRWLTVDGLGTVQLLDENLDVLTVTRVRAAGMPNVRYLSKTRKRYEYLDDVFIGDPRVFALDDGSIAISFIAYELQYPMPLPYPESWWLKQVFGIFHVENTTIEGWKLGPPRLDAWVDRKELRTIVPSPDPSNVFDDPITKNMNYIQRPGGDLHVMNWVYPPSVGKFDVKAPPMQNNGSIIGTTYYGYSEPSRLSDESVFGICPPVNTIERADKSRKVKYNKPSGNGPPVWIDEIQSFLGVSHFHKGWSDSVESFNINKKAGTYGHHYTHFFFTLSKEEPFKLTSMSPEWCIPSDHDSQDCEVIQFVNGMQRDNQSIVLTYGVMDKYGYIAKVNLSTVLSSLRPVA